ncbi:MAG TPA: hypothetical protein DD379_22750 [Cyanobacteria bacterium UBA11162]|nr:hypothetical protein [Cyanobacteria bacterium UBA11162]
MSSGGKYGDLIKKAREPENQKENKPDDQKGGKPDDQKPEVALVEQEVNLCVKVPISLRRHWSAEAKRTGVTMTEVIIEALKARFGEPD